MSHAFACLHVNLRATIHLHILHKWWFHHYCTIYHNIVIAWGNMWMVAFLLTRCFVEVAIYFLLWYISYCFFQILIDRFAKTSSDVSQCSDLSNYCGGTYQGVIRMLDYIQGLGANAIWISPIPEQTPKGYHGYWQMNISNINPHFGTSADLRQLVSECHKRGIWVMLDV